MLAANDVNYYLCTRNRQHQRIAYHSNINHKKKGKEMVFYKLMKNNARNKDGKGKWYARITSIDTLDYRSLCRHLASHTGIWSEDICLGMINRLQRCILEQLLEGKKVRFGDLGTFYLSGTSTGVEQVSDFRAQDNISSIYLRFSPNRSYFNRLTSKKLRGMCQLRDINDLVSEEASFSS